MQRAVLALVLCAVIAGCAPSRSEPEFLVAPGGAWLPLSPAVRAGGLIFLAGTVGVDSTGKLVPGGIEAETRQTMENIGKGLARVGSSFGARVEIECVAAA